MSESENGLLKIEWQGTIVSIQPRTTVWRYRIDNRTHGHIGYNIFLNGEADGIKRQFAIAISEKQQQTVSFRIGDVAKGTAWTKKYPQWEFADYYRAGGLKRIKPNDAPADESAAPPWRGAPPDMATYEWRGCRVLSKSCWKGKCFQCKWATMANVTIEYDWGRQQKFRFENFCYDPKSCKCTRWVNRRWFRTRATVRAPMNTAVLMRFARRTVDGTTNVAWEGNHAFVCSDKF